jgi:dihydrolipoamide dehydrogenase
MLKRWFSRTNTYDLTVIGGGPGGYVGAIKAAQLGLKVACVEKRGALGGTCLNVGCIPSKALLNMSHRFHDMQHVKRFGLSCDNPRYDWQAMLKIKDDTVKKLTGGIEYLFNKNKVDYLRGSGTFLDQNTLAIHGADGKESKITSDNFLIATGSEPRALPGFAFDEKVYISSTGALALDKVPKHMLIIGAGVIGLELGAVYRRLGSEITVIGNADRICPALDSEIGKEFTRCLKKDGFKLLLGKNCLKGEVDQKTGEAVVYIEDIKTGKKETIRGDVCLLAAGRNPYTHGLGLEKVGIKLDNLGRVPINEKFQTTLPNIFAIGDVVEGPMLAHKAEEEGIAVAELLTGHAIHINYNSIPGVIYTDPEIAWVGQTSEQLKELGIEFGEGKFPFSANSRAVANLNDSPGLVKLLFEKKTQKILGAHIMCPGAGEMIHELVLAIEYGATVEDIARASHGHPTLSEAVKEAALAGFFKPIHI